MKTAISIPDPVFEAAEDMAKHLGMSRSELFSTAISEYMKNHRYYGVKDSLNRIYGNETSALDKQLTMMQMHSMQQEEW